MNTRYITRGRGVVVKGLFITFLKNTSPPPHHNIFQCFQEKSSTLKNLNMEGSFLACFLGRHGLHFFIGKYFFVLFLPTLGLEPTTSHNPNPTLYHLTKASRAKTWSTSVSNLISIFTIVFRTLYKRHLNTSDLVLKFYPILRTNLSYMFFFISTQFCPH